MGADTNDTSTAPRDTIVLAYDVAEDRLVLSAYDGAGEARSAALTRRLVGGLLEALAHVLVATSPLARVVPPGLVEDVALSEHRDAVRSYREAHALEAAPEEAPPAPVDTYVGAGMLPLVTRVAIDPLEAGGVLLAIDTGETRLTTLRLSREEAHAFLESLRSRAAGIDWRLPKSPAATHSA